MLPFPPIPTRQKNAETLLGALCPALPSPLFSANHFPPHGETRRRFPPNGRPSFPTYIAPIPAVPSKASSRHANSQQAGSVPLGPMRPPGCAWTWGLTPTRLGFSAPAFASVRTIHLSFEASRAQSQAMRPFPEPAQWRSGRCDASRRPRACRTAFALRTSICGCLTRNDLQRDAIPRSTRTMAAGSETRRMEGASSSPPPALASPETDAHAPFPHCHIPPDGNRVRLLLRRDPRIELMRVSSGASRCRGSRLRSILEPSPLRRASDALSEEVGFPRTPLVAGHAILAT